MPFSDFTKAVNFFVVGSFTVAVVALWMWAFEAKAVVEFFQSGAAQSAPESQHQSTGTAAVATFELSSGAALVLVTLLLPLSLFVGMLVEGVSSYARFIASSGVERLARHRRGLGILEAVCLLLGVRHSFRHMQAARRQFVSLVERARELRLGEEVDPEQEAGRGNQESPEYEFYAEVGKPGRAISLEKRYRIAATGIALKESSKESFTWMTSHYSTYVLCTNYALVAIPAVILVANLTDFSFAWFFAVLVSALFIHIALDRRLYSYELAYSQAFAHLALKGEEDLELFISRLGF